jgi:hypothetical protein
VDFWYINCRKLVLAFHNSKSVCEVGKNVGIHAPGGKYEILFFAYRNESGTFYTQKGSESSTFLHEKSYVVLFCIILFISLEMIVKAYLFFFCNFPFTPNFSTVFDMQKNSVYNTL